MTLLFTSLFSAGAMPAPPAPPKPDFPWTANLLYRFSASKGVHKDDEGTPAADGDAVARWLNLGSAEDAIQTVAAHRLWIGIRNDPRSASKRDPGWKTVNL